MIKHKWAEKLIEVPDKVICDICKKEFDAKKDDMEVQEFIYVRNIGGYSSIFGDGEEIYYDICQHCFQKFVEEAEKGE